MNFTDKLDLLMASKNINKRELSIQSGIPYMTIVNFYEKGTDNIKLSTLRKLAKFFNVTLDFWANDNITDANPVISFGNKKNTTPNQRPSYEEMERLIEQAEQGNVGQHTLAYGGLYEEDEVTKTLNALEQQDGHSRDEYNILMELMNSKSGAVVFGYDAGEWKRETLSEKEAEVVFNLLHTLRK